MAEKPSILVTGGASGIGRAIVGAVLRQGWRAVVADLDHDSLDRFANELEAHAGELRFERLDVTDEAAVERCLEQCGAVTGVVNSAGIGRNYPALETPVAEFRRVLEINLLGSFIVARAAARAIGRRGGEGGSIVNISSISGQSGNMNRVAYGASKGGIDTMTRVLATEWAPLGIRVNAIAPGPIATPMAQAMHSDAVKAAWARTVPMARYGRPEEIAELALFLLDPGRSGYITGQIVAVDGGFSAAGIFEPTIDRF
ncbi:MAG: SDR family oxidoreductase [Geminicoccaceae bacterium]|nr:SDR family oxidoreductase [Geminicoccaceae bacterium]